LKKEALEENPEIDSTKLAEAPLSNEDKAITLEEYQALKKKTSPKGTSDNSTGGSSAKQESDNKLLGF